MYYINQIVPS